MDNEKIEAGVRMILEGIGEDPDREGLLKTPARVARMYNEVFGGMTEDPHQHFETLFDEHHEEMVLVKDIPFYSMCEHHLLPFYGKAHVAYIPDGYITGLSKIARVVETYARRLQVQERLKMHPYAAKQTARQCARLSAAWLTSIYDRCVTSDFEVKSGRLREQDALNELLFRIGLAASRS